MSYVARQAGADHLVSTARADLPLGGIQESRAPTLLQSALDLHRDIGGTIFCVGQVLRESRFESGDRKPDRLRDRIYADIGRLWIPDPPVAEQVVRKHIAISRRASITHVSPTAATAIVSEMAQCHNEMPGWLAEAEFGRIDPVRISSENWRECVSRDDYRVFSESELRHTFADFLATTLSNGRPWYAECRCHGSTAQRGTADYMVPLDAAWLPIEAKLRIGKPDDAIRQVQSYLKVDAFSPSVGDERGRKFACRTHDFGILVDYKGIYAIGHTGFIACDIARPLIARRDLWRWTTSDIRERVRSLGRPPFPSGRPQAAS